MFREFSCLMDQIYENVEKELNHELQEKIYQQKILYAQINPHFLYNTLSSINSRAIMADQPEISDMLVLLSTFYRTALNRGKDMTTLGNELNNVQAYIQLQLLSYPAPPDIVYQLDETLSDTTLPNFILQPLVENALEHGLKKSCRKDKQLMISTTKETDTNGQEFVIIQIEDNGQGMNPDTVDRLLHTAGAGYGIHNVNERLQLLYNDNYSFTIESRLEGGTLVTLKIPHLCLGEPGT